MNNLTDIIIRAARGEAYGAELRRLQLWCAEAPENEEWYADVCRVVDLGRKLQGDIDDHRRISAGTVLRRAAARAEDKKVAAEATRLVSRSPTWRRLAGAVAAVTIIFGSAGLAERLFVHRPDFVPAEADRMVEYETGSDVGRSIQVSEGILAHLGPSSRIEVRASGQDVRLWLEGRAFFGVEGRPDRPVVIETPGGSISVLGTRFEAYSQHEELQLLVVDGSVGVTAGGEEVRVTSGERGVVTQGVIAAPIRIDDPLMYLDWMGRGMVFQRTPLDRVASEIAFRYGVSVTLGESPPTQRTLTTAFDGQSLEEVVAIVCRAVQITCRVEDDVVVLGVE